MALTVATGGGTGGTLVVGVPETVGVLEAGSRLLDVAGSLLVGLAVLDSDDLFVIGGTVTDGAAGRVCARAVDCPAGLTTCCPAPCGDAACVEEQALTVISRPVSATSGVIHRARTVTVRHLNHVPDR
ncbi:MAG: hypothetical protein ABI232_08065 [Jatrophihabitantaceae bacterium]